MGEPHHGMKNSTNLDCVASRIQNSPTIFGNQLAKELEIWRGDHPGGVMLQYVDDILLAAETWEECIQMTVELLRTRRMQSVQEGGTDCKTNGHLPGI